MHHRSASTPVHLHQISGLRCSSVVSCSSLSWSSNLTKFNLSRPSSLETQKTPAPRFHPPSTRHLQPPKRRRRKLPHHYPPPLPPLLLLLLLYHLTDLRAEAEATRHSVKQTLATNIITISPIKMENLSSKFTWSSPVVARLRRRRSAQSIFLSHVHRHSPDDRVNLPFFKLGLHKDKGAR